MKSVSKILLGMIAIGLIAFNLNVGKGSQSTITDYSLINVKALQAYAIPGEIKCDATNTTECTIGEAKGTGRLISTP